MLDLSVIILTYNEELHIRRCLEKIAPYVKQVFIIDCFSSDKTLEIAREYSNVMILQNKWPATKYAGQFNWALENAPIDSKWVLRLDADEYLLPETIAELNEKLKKLIAIIPRSFFLDLLPDAANLAIAATGVALED